jgi:hypothetical protein
LNEMATFAEAGVSEKNWYKVSFWTIVKNLEIPQNDLRIDEYNKV